MCIRRAYCFLTYWNTEWCLHKALNLTSTRGSLKMKKNKLLKCAGHVQHRFAPHFTQSHMNFLFFFRMVWTYNCSSLKNKACELFSRIYQQERISGLQKSCYLALRLYCGPMRHEVFIFDKLIPQYHWGDQPPNCKGADVNVRTMLVVSENHQTLAIVQ